MPWKKISSEVVYENPWFQVRRDEVIKPNGGKGGYSYVDGLNAVAVIPEEDSSIYLVKQTRYPIGNIPSWEVVVGGIELNEDVLLAAKRELIEETGLEAQNWIDMGGFFPATGYSSEKANFFIASNLQEGEQKLDSTEDIIIGKFSIEKVKEMIANGEIIDGFSMAVILKYLLYKNKI